MKVKDATENTRTVAEMKMEGTTQVDTELHSQKGHESLEHRR